MTLRSWAATVVAVVVACGSMLLGFPAEAPAQTAITGGTVHPVDGEPIADGTVVIGNDGTISAVGADVEVPDGATVVEADGSVVTPGLIDARTRLGLVEIWAVERTHDYKRGGSSPIRAAFRAGDGFDPSSVAIPVTRTGGVTSAVIVPGGGLVSGQSGWIDLVGDGIGYGSLASSSVGMHVRYRAKRSSGSFASRGALLETLRELYDDVRFYRDNREAFDSNRARDLAASRLDLQALNRTLEGGMPSVFEVHKASDIRTIVEFADEQTLDPVITGGAEAWKVAEWLGEREVPVVVNPTLNLPTSFETYGARTDNAARLAEAGVPVVLSTFGTHNVRKLRQMAGNAVRAGMDHAAALKAVTLNPARAFGMADRYGSLTAGKVANVVVWSGDPFEFSSRVEHMFVRGHEVSLESRQTELFERYRTLERRGEPASEGKRQKSKGK